MKLPTVFESTLARVRDEGGAISVLNLFFVVVLIVFTGLAVDVASLTASKTQLQVAADAAGHAALYKRKSMDASAAKAEAIKIARVNMPVDVYGNVLTTSNIKFGTYDQATRRFTVDDSSTEAVLVETNRIAANANPVSSFLLHFIGFWDWDVRTEAVFVRPPLPCASDGFYARQRVDMQSNNGFYNEFCVHSDAQVEFNQNNFFDVEEGVRVSVPSYSDIIVPGGSFAGNTGLYEARREGGPYNFNVDEYITEIISDIGNPNSDHWRDFITDSAIIDVAPGSGGWVSTVRSKSKKNNGNGNGNSGGDTGGDTGGDSSNGNGGGGNGGGLSMADLTPGRIHRVSCSGGSLDVAGEVFANVVVITDCTFDFANGSALENATFITESTDTRTIKAPQGLRIGRDDNCAFGGGAQLISRGGMRTAAKLQLYGGQIIVAGDLNFAAQGNGFGGASVIAGGEIDGTSNSDMGLCDGGNGMEDFFIAKARPRMVN